MPSRAIALRQFADIRFQVLFHSRPRVLFAFPSRYLFAIGHQRVFSLGEWSPLIRAGFHVPGVTQGPAGSRCAFAYGALTLSRAPFQALRLALGFHFPALTPGGPYDPGGMNPPGLDCSLFARHYWGNLVDFFSSWYCDVSLPMVASLMPIPGPGGPVFAMGFPGVSRDGFPIRIPADRKMFAPPRRFSQLAASFFGFWCQGIHHIPFKLAYIS